MSIKPETLAWLRQTAKFEGAVTAQAILHLLERVEVLEAKDQLDAEAWASMRRASCDYQRRLVNLEAAQQPRQDKLDRLIEQDREADDKAAPVVPDEELWSLWANRPLLPNSAATALRAIYDLGRQHGAAQPTPPVAPVSDSKMAAYNHRAAARFARLDCLEKAIDFSSYGWELTSEGAQWQQLMAEQGQDECEMGL